MNFLTLLEAKRDGRELTPQQLQDIVSGCIAGLVPDYQMAAFLMAVYFQGLSAAETRGLTMAMRDSGDRLTFPDDPRPLADKHSTGGVGDKVSLPLAPLLACLGLRVPMISGRGLGITGGTLDKLDSIPGFQTSLPMARIVELVQNVGCVICGQSERMVPADKILYALRDVTATVPSISLIVSSILSKKLAEGLNALILDVKFGSAAFMPTLDKARELAQALVGLGNDCGVRTQALLTDMDAPLGRAAGNWLEIKEAVACLEPTTAKRARVGSSSESFCDISDLRGLVLTCAAHLLVQTGKAASFEAAGLEAEQCLASGAPRKKWDEMLAGQGADMGTYTQMLKMDHRAPAIHAVKAAKAGYIVRCNARLIGEVIRDLGGGRLAKNSVLDYTVGVDRLAKPGDKAATGDILARVHAAATAQANEAAKRLIAAFEISDQAPAPKPLIVETL